MTLKEEVKLCSCCKEIKLMTCFYKKTKSTYRNPCKICSNSRSKEWVTNNPIRRKEIAKKWDDINKDHRKQASINHREKHPTKALFNAAKNRARLFGLAFEITEEDIKIPDVCPVFGYKLEINSGKNGGSFNSPSLDKIKPSLGYIKGNIQVISSLANTMKNNASEEELTQFAHWILKTNDNRLKHTENTSNT